MDVRHESRSLTIKQAARGLLAWMNRQDAERRRVSSARFFGEPDPAPHPRTPAEVQETAEALVYILLCAISKSKAIDKVIRAVRRMDLGELNKILRCKRCGKWFLGSKKNQRFCSTKCRTDAGKDKPGYKKWWREYMKQKMREYRKQAKELDVINLKAAKRRR